MIKEVPCMECDGKGFIAKFGEHSVWSERCPNCGGTGIVKIPMTNADRIRAMSDEDLAKFLSSIYGSGTNDGNMRDGFIWGADWLRQSAEED